MRVTPLSIHVARAYRGPGPGAVDDLVERILRLEELDRFIRERREVSRREQEVYDAELRPGVELWRALFERHACLPDGARKILGDVLTRSRELTLTDIEDDPPLASVGLWPVDAPFVVEGDEWLRFRRETIHSCGVTAESFFEQVGHLFPNLVLSSAFPACLGTLEGGFDQNLRIVVSALTALNDELLPALGDHQIVEGLRRFSAVSGYETTMEGSADRNAALTFSFLERETTKRVVCAPHMKLASSGMPGDSHHYANRIYFNPHQEDASRPRIHVGHVGGHL